MRGLSAEAEQASCRRTAAARRPRAGAREPAVDSLSTSRSARSLREVQRYRAQEHPRRLAFVYVTHDQEEALTMSDRITSEMNRGVIDRWTSARGNLRAAEQAWHLVHGRVQPDARPGRVELQHRRRRYAPTRGSPSVCPAFAACRRCGSVVVRPRRSRSHRGRPASDFTVRGPDQGRRSISARLPDGHPAPPATLTVSWFPNTDEARRQRLPGRGFRSTVLHLDSGRWVAGKTAIRPPKRQLLQHRLRLMRGETKVSDTVREFRGIRST